MAEEKYDYEEANKAYMALESDFVLEMLDDSQRYVLTKRLRCREYQMYQKVMSLLDPNSVHEILKGEGYGEQEIREFIEGNI